MRSRQSSAVLRVLPIVATVATPFVLLRRALDINALPKTTFVVLVALLCLGLWLAEVVARRLTIPWGWPAVGAALLGTALAAAAVSAPVAWYAYVGQPNRANGLLLYGSCLILFYLIAARWNADDVRRWEWGFLAATLGLLVLATGQIIAGPLPGAGHVEVFATLGNPNFLSGLLGIGLPLLAGMALRSAGLVRLGLITAALWAVVLIVVSDSVQGLFAGAAGLIVLLATWLWTKDGAARTKVLPLLLAGSLITGLLGLAGLADVGPLSPLVHIGTLETRQWYWQAAVGMAEDHPVLGVGLGHYADSYRRYRPAGATSVLDVANTADSAHSVPLGLAAEGGLLLLAAYLLFAAVVGVRLVRGIRHQRAGNDVLLLGGIGGAWVAYHTQAAVSIDMSVLVLTHFLLAGAIVALTGGARKVVQFGAVNRKRPSWAVPVVVVIALLTAGAGWWATAPVRASRGARYGRVLIQSGRTEEGLAYFRRAEALTPRNPLVYAEQGGAFGNAKMYGPAYKSMREALKIAPLDFPYTLTAARLADHLNLVEDADSLYARVLELDPTSPEVLDEVATYRLKRGAAEESERLVRLSLREDPRRGEAWLLLGNVLRSQGRLMDAKDAYRKATSLLTDPKKALAAIEAIDAAQH